MLYKKQLRKQRMKSAMIISFLLLFALIATYAIYNTFKDARDEKVNSPHLEVIYHSSDQIELLQFHSVTDSVGLSSQPYKITIQNQTNHPVSYKIELIDDIEKEKTCDCPNKIPKELLKLSVRKGQQVADAILLSEYPNAILRTDSLEANQKEEYTIRIWPVNSSFVVDSKSHYHGKLKVSEL